MTHLEYFKSLFPSHRLQNSDGELRYIFISSDYAKICEGVAMKIIRRHKLPLLADVEIWQSGDRVREIALVIRPAPDSYFIEKAEGPADECQDDEGLLNHGQYEKREN